MILIESQNTPGSLIQIFVKPRKFYETRETKFFFFKLVEENKKKNIYENFVYRIFIDQNCFCEDNLIPNFSLTIDNL